MPHRPRNFKAEYARRIANAMARGLSRSQARGHAKATEAPPRGPPRPIEDGRLQLALRTLRRQKSLSEAARAARISPERLRKHAIERGLIEKTGRRWRTSADLPRQIKIFSEGKSLTATVDDLSAASLAGKYMSAVGQFLETNDLSPLAPFVGQSVRNMSGKDHPLETRPNVLYRLASAGEPTFEQVYRVVI